jgi:hypothetical protein
MLNTKMFYQVVSGEAVYKPGSKEGSIGAKYTYSFKKGGKI